MTDNKTIDVILRRHSTRKYSSEMPQAEQIRQVIEAARHAPSGRNNQSRLYTCVRNQAKIEQLAHIIGAHLQRTNYGFYGAPCLIIVSVPTGSEFGIADTACAMQNMMLAAESLNLGSVWINQFRHCNELAEMRQVYDEMGIPSDHAVHAVLALGYAATEPTAVERREEVNYID